MEISNIFNILTSSRFADELIIYQKISQILVDSPFVGYDLVIKNLQTLRYMKSSR